eukprot:COSAG06_NODE_20821_length_780_cov_0.863436_1_plen_61_part_10
MCSAGAGGIVVIATRSTLRRPVAGAMLRDGAVAGPARRMRSHEARAIVCEPVHVLPALPVR